MIIVCESNLFSFTTTWLIFLNNTRYQGSINCTGEIAYCGTYPLETCIPVQDHSTILKQKSPTQVDFIYSNSLNCSTNGATLLTLNAGKCSASQDEGFSAFVRFSKRSLVYSYTFTEKSDCRGSVIVSPLAIGHCTFFGLRSEEVNTVGDSVQYNMFDSNNCSPPLLQNSSFLLNKCYQQGGTSTLYSEKLRTDLQLKKVRGLFFN